MLRFYLTTFLVFISACSLNTLPANALEFSDLNPKDIPAVTILSEKGVLNGFEDSTFKPNQYITKAEVITMLVRALADETQIKSASCELPNITDHWAEQYIACGYQLGLVQQSNNHSFQPDEFISVKDCQDILLNMFESYAGQEPTVLEANGTDSNAILTRGVYAQMLYSILDQPIHYSVANRNSYEIIEKMNPYYYDGTSFRDYYLTLLGSYPCVRLQVENTSKDADVTIQILSAEQPTVFTVNNRNVYQCAIPKDNQVLIEFTVDAAHAPYTIRFSGQGNMMASYSGYATNSWMLFRKNSSMLKGISEIETISNLCN